MTIHLGNNEAISFDRYGVDHPNECWSDQWYQSQKIYRNSKKLHIFCEYTNFHLIIMLDDQWIRLNLDLNWL